MRTADGGKELPSTPAARCRIERNWSLDDILAAAWGRGISLHRTVRPNNRWDFRNLFNETILMMSIGRSGGNIKAV
jgi:hypothetical protein